MNEKGIISIIVISIVILACLAKKEIGISLFNSLFRISFIVNDSADGINYCNGNQWG